MFSDGMENGGCSETAVTLYNASLNRSNRVHPFSCSLLEVFVTVVEYYAA